MGELVCLPGEKKNLPKKYVVSCPHIFILVYFP